MPQPSAWDRDALAWVAAHRSEELDRLATAVMHVGPTVAGVAVCGLVVALFVRRFPFRPAAVAVLGSVAVAGLLVSGLKSLVGRPRPPADLALVVAQGSAFPSTQAAQTAAVAAAVLVAVPWPSRRGRCVAAVLAGLVLAGIGACMVYLGAHWVTDVLAGWLLGGACGAGAGMLARRLAPRLASRLW